MALKWNKELLLGELPSQKQCMLLKLASLKRWRRKENFFMSVLGNSFYLDDKIIFA